MKLKTRFIIGLILIVYVLIGLILEIIMIPVESMQDKVEIIKSWYPLFLFFGLLAGWIRFILLLLGIYLVLKTKPLYWRSLFLKELKDK